MKIHKLYRIIPLLLAIAFSPGCGKKDDTQKGATKDKDKAATQVAARVNAEEITVHQINNILERNPKIPSEAASQAKYEILNRLIDQQLAKQQAIEKKLDRSPRVMQAIEAARNEILARAYLEQITNSQSRPTPDDVKKYYTEHPELFAQRRVFNLEEIVVAVQEGLAAKLREQVANAKSLEPVAAWLRGQDIIFVPSRGVRAAEALPLDLLPKVQAMKDGDIRLIEANERIYVLRLVASQSSPVTETQATPRIQQFLFNRSTSELAVAEMKKLKDAANIEFVGEFTGGAAAAKAKAEAEAKAKAQADVKLKTQTELDAQAKAEAKAKAQAEADARADALSKARREAEEKSRLEAEAGGKSPAKKPLQASQESIDKGIRGFK